jgi:ribonuclease HI
MTIQYPHNRQLPLAQKYQDLIFNEEIRAREGIIAEQCKAKTQSPKKKGRTRTSNGLKTIAADVVVHVATSMKKNPGPGSYAMTIINGNDVIEESDYHQHMTGPLLDLEATIAALRFVQDLPGTVAIHTSARSTVEYINDGLAETWRRNGWQRSSGDAVANADSWAELLRLCDLRKPLIAWLNRGSTSEMKYCEAVAAETFRTEKPVSQEFLSTVKTGSEPCGRPVRQGDGGAPM